MKCKNCPNDATRLRCCPNCGASVFLCAVCTDNVCTCKEKAFDRAPDWVPAVVVVPKGRVFINVESHAGPLQEGKKKVESSDSNSIPLEDESTLDSMTGTAAVLDAQFHTSAFATGKKTDRDARRARRVQRPGCVLLPNLDIDEEPGKPRRRFKYDAADGLNDGIDPGDDAGEISPLVIAASGEKHRAYKIVLRIREEDAKRINVWVQEIDKCFKSVIPQGGPDSLVQMATYGEKTAKRHPVRKAERLKLSKGFFDFVLVDVATDFGKQGFGPKDVEKQCGWSSLILLEARTLCYDRKRPAPLRLAPSAPGEESLPSADADGDLDGLEWCSLDSSDASIYPNDVRNDLPKTPAGALPGEIWFELLHYDAKGGEIEDLRDVGLFTIAPWLMTWNGLPCERVYVVGEPPLYQAKTMADRKVLGSNHAMVWDLQQACTAAGLQNEIGPVWNPDSSVPVSHSSRTDNAAPHKVQFCVVGQGDEFLNQWIQDEFEIGYCLAPHAWMHVAMVCSKSDFGQDLGKFSNEHLAHAGLGVFTGIRLNESKVGQDYGGNIEVSPPVMEETSAEFYKEAGPDVPAHPVAPFGKILLGDMKGGKVSDDLRAFLLAQRIQPVLPFNTAWLQVGHVDEVMSFVRAKNKRGCAGLVASATMMQILLEGVVKMDPLATIHAGKYRRTGPGQWAYGEELVSDWADGPISKKNAEVQRKYLSPIKSRLESGVALAKGELLPVPCFFKEEGRNETLGDDTYVARGPGMVNLLVVNGDLMVPRPFGPRLPPDQAMDALVPAFKELEATWGLAAKPIITGVGLDFWARPGEALDHIAMAFAPMPRTKDFETDKGRRKKCFEAIEKKHISSSLDGEHPESVRQLKETILSHKRNQGDKGVRGIKDNMNGGDFTRWMKIHIPDGCVDVLEVFMAGMLEAIGCRPWFIDAFESYHELHGEVHCGTNALRTPLELTGYEHRWWDEKVYRPSDEESCTYDPDIATDGC